MLGATVLSGCMFAPVAVAHSLTQPGYLERPGTVQLALSDIDQQQTIIDGSASGLAIGGDSNQILGQVVTVGVSGFLTEVRLPVACDLTSDLVIEIQLVAAGKPNGIVLVSQHISGSDLPAFFPSPPSFRTLQLSTPVYRKGGSQFAI